MTPEAQLSPTDLLTEVVEPGRKSLSPDVSREILALRYLDEANTRNCNLLPKNKEV